MFVKLSILVNMADSFAFVDGSNIPHTDGVDVSLMGWPNRCWVLPHILCPGSCCQKVDLAYFVPVVTLMRMTPWDCPPLKVGSSSGQGTRWPLT